ncbi:MAG: GNAT family N-acetyltransferase [Ilumatobacteraceae bacterium]
MDESLIVTRRATADELDACAEVLSRAFADSPWIRWTVDGVDHVRRIRDLQLLALQRLSMPLGQVWVTTVDGTVACVAGWMDSATPVSAATLAEMGPIVAMLEGDRHQPSLAASAGSFEPDVSDRHFMLGTIGTDPTLQRNGLGDRTADPVLAQADELSVDCVLETSTEWNVRFYERLGFRTVDHRVITHGGPDVWTMVRPPAATSRPADRPAR